MKRLVTALALSVLLVFILSGCVVRSYQVTKDRVDQNISEGNRGYMKGQPPAGSEKERKMTRTTEVVEIELRSPIKFEQKAKVKTTAPEKQITEVFGNQGYITQSDALAVQEAEPVSSEENFEKYTVEKNDTLQKISQKFYGTTKKWAKIYEANKDILSSPNRVYPGQVINIPVEKMNEPRENLK